MEIPVGVVTALCGGPFFVYLLRREGGRCLAERSCRRDTVEQPKRPVDGLHASGLRRCVSQLVDVRRASHGPHGGTSRVDQTAGPKAR